MTDVRPEAKPVQRNRDELIDALRQHLAGTFRWAGASVVLGGLAVLYGWSSFQQELDAGRHRWPFSAQLPVWGSLLVVIGLLAFWLAPRYTRRLVRSVEADVRVSLLMTVERKELPGDDNDVLFVATLYTPKQQRVVLQNVHFRQGYKPLAYPFEEGVSLAPVQVYGRPGRGPIVIDAGWAFLLPANLTYPWYK
ncbi:hypothetical protein BHS09_06640 [Myxococcus xanthus]|uniref:Uncharacterized protein n=1 Tax=Myxococcus xanthus TaxID=34 RepID=A0AAE6FWI5_MYXXA|nr:hypothetical protein [Myxococcus xanthus]QDE66710.1 hypothetical protein BHS09_06640 [Myxococcus xanthus]QDE73983.1 hypothetical protein BHS08_06645 [Myxococcus xanthus]